jgi:hypothetical protein
MKTWEVATNGDTEFIEAAGMNSEKGHLLFWNTKTDDGYWTDLVAIYAKGYWFSVKEKKEKANG